MKAVAFPAGKDTVLADTAAFLLSLLTELLSSLQVWTIHLVPLSSDELDLGWRGNGEVCLPLWL